MKFLRDQQQTTCKSENITEENKCGVNQYAIENPGEGAQEKITQHHHGNIGGFLCFESFVRLGKKPDERGDQGDGAQNRLQQ